MTSSRNTIHKRFIKLILVLVVIFLASFNKYKGAYEFVNAQRSMKFKQQLEIIKELTKELTKEYPKDFKDLTKKLCDFTEKTENEMEETENEEKNSDDHINEDHINDDHINKINNNHIIRILKYLLDKNKSLNLKKINAMELTKALKKANENEEEEEKQSERDMMIKILKLQPQPTLPPLVVQTVVPPEPLPQPERRPERRPTQRRQRPHDELKRI